MQSSDALRSKYIKNYSRTYIHGTAAAIPAPRIDKEEVPSKSPRRKPASRKVRALARRYIVFAVLGVLLCASCIICLSVRAKMTSTTKRIDALKSQIQEQRAANDAKEIEINKSIDLQRVYEIATTRLNMIYPTEDKIIYYDRADGGYVKQYEDIPNG